MHVYIPSHCVAEQPALRPCARLHIPRRIELYPSHAEVLAELTALVAPSGKIGAGRAKVFILPRSTTRVFYDASTRGEYRRVQSRGRHDFVLYPDRRHAEAHRLRARFRRGSRRAAARRRQLLPAGLSNLQGRCAHVEGCDIDPVVLTNPFLDHAEVIEPGKPLPYPDNNFDIVFGRSGVRAHRGPRMACAGIAAHRQTRGLDCGFHPE
jgi:hypothetical protein